MDENNSNDSMKMEQDAQIAVGGPRYHKTRKGKRPRGVFNQEQILKLEESYIENHYLTLERTTYLSTILNVDKYQIQQWFKNKRTRDSVMAPKKFTDPRKMFQVKRGTAVPWPQPPRRTMAVPETRVGLVLEDQPICEHCGHYADHTIPISPPLDGWPDASAQIHNNGVDNWATTADMYTTAERPALNHCNAYDNPAAAVASAAVASTAAYTYAAAAVATTAAYTYAVATTATATATATAAAAADSVAVSAYVQPTYFLPPPPPPPPQPQPFLGPIPLQPSVIMPPQQPPQQPPQSIVTTSNVNANYGTLSPGLLMAATVAYCNYISENRARTITTTTSTTTTNTSSANNQ